MFRFLIWTCIPLLLFACAPLERPAEIAECTSRSSHEQLLIGNWLQQPGVWTLRQSALLEIGLKKIPMHGMLRLDTLKREARLVAMNDMGLVLFDLQLDEQGQQLRRAVPQLQKRPAFAIGVADSLRRIFLQPVPLDSDHLQQRSSEQRLWRLLPGGSLGFIFSCSGELQETRQLSDDGDWRVTYSDYQPITDQSIPRQIVFNDYQHGVKLSLWLREVKRDNE